MFGLGDLTNALAEKLPLVYDISMLHATPFLVVGFEISVGVDINVYDSVRSH